MLQYYTVCSVLYWLRTSNTRGRKYSVKLKFMFVRSALKHVDEKLLGEERDFEESDTLALGTLALC